MNSKESTKNCVWFIKKVGMRCAIYCLATVHRIAFSVCGLMSLLLFHIFFLHYVIFCGYVEFYVSSEGLIRDILFQFNYAFTSFRILEIIWQHIELFNSSEKYVLGEKWNIETDNSHTCSLYFKFYMSKHKF